MPLLYSNVLQPLNYDLGLGYPAGYPKIRIETDSR
ncbi:MAG: hypothetical protein ACI815_001911 [Psychroserpens sp.]|jgi:hypothetical protein